VLFGQKGEGGDRMMRVPASSHLQRSRIFSDYLCKIAEVLIESGSVLISLSAKSASVYRLYWGVYVRRVSWLTRPYLVVIEPFRRVLYPAMLRRIRRAPCCLHRHEPNRYRLMDVSESG
jgi:Protein of unknown function (DUF2867)